MQQLKLNKLNENDFDFYEIFTAKSLDLSAKENGVLLHSAYDPKREAESLVKQNRSENIWAVAFFSMGLGYAPLLWAQNFPDDTIIIIEPSVDYFFAPFKYIDFEKLFRHKNLIIALQAGTDSIIQLIENSATLNHTAIIENSAHTNHAKDYFNALHALIERNRQKEKINTSTLEKFSKLWLKNSCRNLKYFNTLNGINIFKDSCPKNLPTLLVSAGPTLSEILPHLKELKKRCIIIAVDTALRACLNVGVEPDFIVLADPQYYAYRHIAGLKSPSSILITESAAYPSVYRFECKKIVLCSSMFPLGQFFESKTEKKGELGAGGSVSTSAWDFARLIGAKEIFCAGLDLGYPKLQSHIRGSLFEEKAHQKSNRLSPAEKTLSLSLFASNKKIAKDYAQNEIFTDDKMKMFAWWFESKMQQYGGANSNLKSYSLSKKSLYIPGFEYFSVKELLLRPELKTERDTFFKLAEEKSKNAYSNPQKNTAFSKAFDELSLGFDELYKTASKGIRLAEEALNALKQDEFKFLDKLQQIDARILSSDIKEIASLVFPGQNKLEQIFSKVEFPSDKAKANFMRSKIIYSLLLDSIRTYKKELFSD